MKLTINHNDISHENLGSEPVNKLLFQMALPSVVAMIMQALYNSVDSMFVAKISSESLAAVTLAFGNIFTQAVDYFIHCYDKVTGLISENDAEARIIRVDTAELADYARELRKGHRD